MRVKLNGKWWRLRMVPQLRDYGDMVDPGRAEGRQIRIGTWQSEEEKLDTILHELLHCVEPCWTEERVAQASREMSRVLWRLGYRRVDSIDKSR
jgi:hypothetical protein